SDWAQRFRLRGLPRRVLVSRLCFAGLVAVNVAIGVICTIDSVQWLGKPFPGFLLNERMFVNGMGRYSWTGSLEGLNFPDKILTANGAPLATPEDLQRIVRQTPVGEPIDYTVERGDLILELSVPTMRFSAADLGSVFGILGLLGVVYLVIGVVVFTIKPDTAVSWSFFLLCFAVSTFSLTAFDIAATHRGFVRWYLLVLALGPAAGLHLVMHFPRPWEYSRRHPGVQLAPYLVAAALIVPLEWHYPATRFLLFYRLIFLYLITASVIFVLGSLAAYLRPSSHIARQRSKVVLFGAALAFPIPALGLLASFSGASLGGFQVHNNFVGIPFTLFPAAIGYAIARHNLFDVDVYIKRTLGYVLMTSVVGLAYFAIQTATSGILSRTVFSGQAESVYPIVFALAVVFFFNPVNRRVQEAVEQLFFRKPYDYRTTVGSISEALGGVAELEPFLEGVLRTIRSELFIERAGVILVDDRTRQGRALFLDGDEARVQDRLKTRPVAFDDPLLALVARERKLISRYDVAEDPHFAPERAACGERFNELGATLAFPLFASGEFAGMLAIGHKKSGHFYSREDIDLLTTVATMTSSAVEQAREKGQRTTLMQLFAKHVSPQVAESLWEQREQFLDGGRPRSQKITATILFTDLQGFSGVSEQLDPETLMEWLNTYMDGITRVVMQHEGVVDDYFGDGVKANFGVPVPRTSEEQVREDAIHAVECALELEREMVRLNGSMKERGLPTLRMRIGIFTGPVLAGSLGSADRMKYTTLGDAVNTAARLESYDRDLALAHLATSPCRILIGDSTLRHLGDRFETQRVGEVTLKGKTERIVAHCVLGRRSAPREIQTG
ncbi:MAG: GAF domain-containing protein, partial [Deltaproteobacteria bacterium]